MGQRVMPSSMGTTSVVSRSLTFPNRWKLIQQGQPSNIVDRWFCVLEHEGYQHLSGSLFFLGIVPWQEHGFTSHL